MYALFYFLLLVFICFVEIFRRKSSRVDAFSLFSLALLLSYIMPAFLWSLAPDLYSKRIPYYLGYNASTRVEVAGVLFFSYVSFFVFYTVVRKVRLPFLLHFNDFSIRRPAEIRKKLVVILLFFVFIVIFNIVLVGGVGEYIASGTEARHFKTQFGLAGYLNYLLSATLFLSIFSVFLLIDNKGAFVKLFVFFVWALLAIGLLSRGGRGGMVSVFIYLLVYLYYEGNLKIGFKSSFLVLFAAFSSLFVIFFLRNISNNILSGEPIFYGVDIGLFVSSFGEILIYPFQYFSHYLFVIVEFFKDPEVYGYPRMGADHLSGLVLLIPGLSGEAVGFPELPDIISQDVLGAYGGYIPPGWIAWALMDGGFIYLLIKSFLSAFICVFIDKSYDGFRSTRLGRAVCFILMLFVVGFLFQGTSMNLFRGSIGQFLLLFMLLFLPYLRVGRLSLIR